MADEGREAENYGLPRIPQTHPWLLISHGQDYQRHAFYSISEDRCYTREIPFLRKKMPVCSCYGWLVNQDMETHICSLFNPISMENIELPPIKLMGQLYRAVLSKPPGDPNCHILISVDNHGSYSIAFCKLGDKEFFESKVSWEDDSLTTVTAMRGKIYGLMIPSFTFVTVEIVGSTVQINPMIKDGLKCQINNPMLPDNFSFNQYLVESGDELLYVFQIRSPSSDSQITHFKVFQVNTSDMTCEELDSIGDRVIFLSYCYGMSCLKTEPGIRANCIYYTNSNDNRLYVHNLEDCSRQLKLPCPMTRWDANLCWIGAV